MSKDSQYIVIHGFCHCYCQCSLVWRGFAPCRKLQALVYDILPLAEGAGKRCSECELHNYVVSYICSLHVAVHMLLFLFSTSNNLTDNASVTPHRRIFCIFYLCV